MAYRWICISGGYGSNKNAIRFLMMRFQIIAYFKYQPLAV